MFGNLSGCFGGLKWTLLTLQRTALFIRSLKRSASCLISPCCATYQVALVGSSGLEPPTSRLSGARSNHLSYEPISYLRVSSFFHLAPFGGDDGIRTHDPLLAGQVLSQLSYTPVLLYGCFFFPFRDVGPYLSSRSVAR